MAKIFVGFLIFYRSSRAKVFFKEVFLKILQNSQEKPVPESYF